MRDIATNTKPAGSEEGAEDTVLRRDDGAVAILTLTRPKAYNALSLDAMQRMIAHLAEIDRDPEIACVVIEASGKGFCAGHDLSELKANPERSFREKTFKACSAMMQAVVNLRQPVIAKVHGVATAAGCQLVASCDLAVASEDARFGTPGVNIGLFCSTPMVALSRNVPRKQAMEMLLTGTLFPAEKAIAIGLINRAVPAEDLDAATMELAEIVAGKSRKVVRTGKEAFYRQLEMPLAEAYDYTAEIMVENMEFADAEEGIAAFLEKRPPIWTES